MVVVLPLEARADEKRLAALLHTGRNQVRLAPAGSLVQLCGYTVGNVPPFGHRRRLPVLVDSAVATYATCYAGGGSDEAEIFLTVPELLRASASTVADISKPSEPAGAAAAAAEEAMTAQQQVAAAAAALPLPWRAGQEQVELCGVIAHRRKIAKLLMFANLVPFEAASPAGGGDSSRDPASSAAPAPAQAPAPPAAHGTAAFLRRLWRHPETGAPCEVQLIMGKTLELRLGSEGAAELLRSIRTGQYVRVTGRVQEHLQRPDSLPRDRTHICDMVVSDIKVVEPPAPVPSGPAMTSSSSSGGGGGDGGGISMATSTIGSGSAGVDAAASSLPGGSGLGSAAAGCYQLPAGVEQRVVLVDSEQGLDCLEAALFGDAAQEEAAGSGEEAEAAASRTSGSGAGSSDGSEGSQPRGFGTPDSSSSADSTGQGSLGTLASLDGSTVRYRLVVGLDCEWQPYERGQPKSRVSLLQLATPDAVFLLDMPALCGPGSSGAAGEGSSHGSAGEGSSDGSAGDGSSSGGSGALGGGSSHGSAAAGDGRSHGSAVAGDGSSGDGSVAGSGTSAHAEGGDAPTQQEEQQPGAGQLAVPAAPAAQQLPPLQRRLSSLLARLFGDAGIVKAGFGMGTDLQRLCESYPALPCFGSEEPVPLRSHVDVLLLARTALGGRMPSSRRRMSLTSLAEAVLGVPMDKSEQCSDWGSRPLTQQQLRYAAADAHALVAMYRRLHKIRPGLETPFWVVAFSGRLTDVAAFHPSKRGLPGLASLAGAAERAGPPRRSSSTPRRQLAAARSAAGPDGSPAGDRSVGQTLSLDANVQYLLQTYLGRQLPQGGKAAAVRAAAAFTGRGESGRTPSFPRGCGGLLEWRNAFLLLMCQSWMSPRQQGGGTPMSSSGCCRQLCRQRRRQQTKQQALQLGRPREGQQRQQQCQQQGQEHKEMAMSRRSRQCSTRSRQSGSNGGCA
ncbi:hypothetical protein ABPG75_004132 [Micractinium tetrahymenae]